MIDNITLKSSIPENNVQALCALHPHSKETRVIATGNVISNWNKLEGMYYSISNKNILTIKNSLHKYYKGNNSGRFTYSDSLKAVNKLSDTFGIDFSSSLVKSFEFGVNIPVDRNPKDYLNSIEGFKPKGFSKMDSSNRGNELYYDTESYRFKLYSKSREAMLQSNILRIEITRNSTSKYLSGIQSLSKLITPDSFRILGEELLNKFDMLQFRKGIDFKNLPRPRINDFSRYYGISSNGSLSYLETAKSCLSKKQYEAEQGKIKRLVKDLPVTHSFQLDLRTKIQHELSQVFTF